MSNGQSSVQLSKREIQVLEMVVTGASNQEIAHKLVISINTVKVHMRNIFEKLGVQSRTEAGLRAIQEGLVSMPESEAEAIEDSESFTPKTFLLDTNPPLVLPKWQQIYLVFAALVALLVAILPLVPPATQSLVPSVSVPVIYPSSEQPSQPDTDSKQWTTHNPMPTSRAGLALAAMGEKIFAIGGVRANNQETRSVEIYDSATNTWAEGASKPTATANVGGVGLNEKIYVPGGCTNDGQVIDKLEIYDPHTDTWTQGPAMPNPRCSYGLVAYQDKLYLFGGWNGQQFEDTIFIFSPEDNSWQVSEHTMPYPIGSVGAAVLSEAIYIAGGYDGQDEFDQAYRFNPATGEWLEKGSLQEKRGGLGLVSSNDNLFAIGGGWTQALETSEKYDPKTDTWSEIETPFAGQWRNLGLTIIDTKIYAVGGWDGSKEKFMDSVVSYQFVYQFFLPITTN